MAALLLLLVVTSLSSLAVLACLAYAQRKQAGRGKLQHNVAMQHEQFLAEQRLQHLTQNALQQMLAASRPGNPTAPAGEWYRP